MEERQESGVSFTKIDCYYRANRKKGEPQRNGRKLIAAVVAPLAGMAGVGAAKTFFKIFGVLYGLVAVLGFVVGDGLLLGLISNNMADTWLHLVAVVSLINGFGPSGGPTAATI